MPVTGNKPIGVNYDFSSGAKLKNMSTAVSSGEVVEYDQFQTGLASRQAPVTAGSGINKEGDTLAIDLATAGSDYDELTLSSTSYSSLNGVYTRLEYSAYLEYVGTELDMTIGDSSVEWNAYYKDNGGGVWAVCMKRDTDGSETTNPELGTWLAVLTTTDPSSFSFSGIGTLVVNGFIPNYQAVDSSFVTSSNESADNGRFSPSSADANVSYAVGSAPAGLKFENNRLALDFAPTIADAASTKVFPASLVKTHISEQITSAKDSSNNVFSNAVTQFSGSPSNVQSAIEAVSLLLNALDSSSSSLATVNSNQDAKLSGHDSVLGVGASSSSLGDMSSAGASEIWLSNASTPGSTPDNVKDTLVALATRFTEVYQEMGEVLGLEAFETDFGDGFLILPSDSDAKALFQAAESELQNLYEGLGQFWAPVDAYENSNVLLSSPGGSAFGGADIVTGDRVLLVGQTIPSQNGIYIFNGASSAMTRAADASEDAEYTPNKTVQVLASEDDGISGATFAYTGSDDPAVGSDSLTFAVKAQGVVGDNTITEAKLADSLGVKVNDKADKHAETVALVAGISQLVYHGLDSTDVLVQVRDAAGNVADLEIDVTDPSHVTISSPVFSGSYRVVVIG